MNQPQIGQTCNITRTEIEDPEQRFQALITHFRSYFSRGEQLIFAWMSSLCKDYNGAYWKFYTLSNGGFYMAPNLEDPMKIESFGWQCKVDLSSDAAGLCACLFGVGEIAQKSGEEWPIELYHQIRDYGLEHPEVEGILKVID